ncbi:polyprenyl synthetase family protein [Streptomyces sp. NPDC059003]|uniref:polyprenyl synthetase family protein n=1 Tax=Streptomyces sp. NPDC059003 TaxID=3346691 RepID=UPI0036856CB0
MTAPATLTPAWDADAVRQQVGAVIGEFLDRKQALAADAEIAHLIALFRRFVTGGKKLRPLLCAVGWRAAGGQGTPSALLRVASGLEVFHSFCLIHDDVMDRSALRRGQPTVHRSLAARHRALGPDDAHWLGTCGAVLLGDLAHVWSDELLQTAGLTIGQLHRVTALVTVMRDEVLYGQYLDLQSSARPDDDLATALRVILFKTAKYTIERPLHVGAALAGAPPAVLEACTAYALPLGQAFQLRDDLLGALGSPEQTGKSALDDLREGKQTVLLILARHRADPQQADVLGELVGNPALDEGGAALVRRILRETGADRAVEDMIRERYARALHALEHAPFPAETLPVLRKLATDAAWRAL